MNFTSREITYEELRNGLCFENDKYGIVSYEYGSRRKTFLANPCVGKDDDVFMFVIEADGIPVGRTMLYDTRLKIGEDIVPMSSGSALKVEDSFQKYGLGGEIFYYSYSKKDQKYIIAAGISPQALPLYGKLKYTTFEFPKLLMLKNSKPLIEKFGIHGILLSISSSIINGFISIIHYFHKGQFKKASKGYKIKKLTDVPEWIDEMILNDSHKYAELHDKKWLLWNLNNNFKGHKKDIQSLYGVYKDELPVGFFMTKERFRPNTQGLKNVLIGSIVEWESNCKELDEYKLNLMAANSFSKDIDIIETASPDVSTVKKLKKAGFIHKGYAHVAFKDKTKALSDAGDVKLWRLRYGYADVILT